MGRQLDNQRNDNPTVEPEHLDPKPNRKRQYGALKDNKTWQELAEIVLQPLPPEELELWEGGS